MFGPCDECFPTRPTPMIVAHMSVGPNEANRYLRDVLKRIHAWADQVHCAIDPAAGDAEREIVHEWADAYSVMSRPWVEHEGRFVTEAWRALESAYPLTSHDFIVTIDADEVVIDPDMLKAGAAEFPGQKIALTFHEMFSFTHYRVDGHWKPYTAWIMFPYRPSGVFRDQHLAAGREPTYVWNLTPAKNPVSDLLHYGYATQEDRERKYERYMTLDGGKYHDINHLKSILRPPDLRPWEGGGLLRG